MFTIQEAKGNFFDSAKIMKSVGKARRVVLSKFGSFVRTRARTSIRKRKGVSPPGGPPYSHRGLVRDYLYFAYDASSDSVVIGPALLGGTAVPGTLERLEFGGSVSGAGRVVFITKEIGRDSSGKFVSGGKERVELSGTINYAPRPFMGPALEAERPGLPAMWKDSVK